MDAASLHTPVLLERTLELLAPALERDGAVVLDGTLGMGGHSEAMLQRFPNLRLIGIDRDPDAIALAGKRLEPFADRITLVETTYDNVAGAMGALGVAAIDAALYDLGVSSLQIDSAERGFAYSKDAPLDMRMDQQGDLTAAEIVATWAERDLSQIFHRYGDEKLAGRYARAIVNARESEPIVTSGRLVEILIAATPMAVQKKSGHPAKKVFQALRVVVNNELEVLETAMPAALDALSLGGRMVVLSYQSLEDRIVKRAIAERTVTSAPAGLPQELPEHAPSHRALVRGAELASEAERELNTRSIPVRLRAVERISMNVRGARAATPSRQRGARR
ncbi:16S rRNA (cytosine(1402)-N(4))-methyltransferase RsmH [Humidisolicoccus flavus]|uniref:16S rRNA (cytosine(1402)-N(4))-methyltransferase RsmH n=1 Tax=Humidisolicoccus flavus TaxID=3111414 RepID=UPI0032483DF8